MHFSFGLSRERGCHTPSVEWSDRCSEIRPHTALEIPQTAVGCVCVCVFFRRCVCSKCVCVCVPGDYKLLPTQGTPEPRKPTREHIITQPCHRNSPRPNRLTQGLLTAGIAATRPYEQHHTMQHFTAEHNTMRNIISSISILPENPMLLL